MSHWRMRNTVDEYIWKYVIPIWAGEGVISSNAQVTGPVATGDIFSSIPGLQLIKVGTSIFVAIPKTQKKTYFYIILPLEL